jgi:hypothetical protein
MKRGVMGVLRPSYSQPHPQQRPAATGVHAMDFTHGTALPQSPIDREHSGGEQHLAGLLGGAETPVQQRDALRQPPRSDDLNAYAQGSTLHTKCPHHLPPMISSCSWLQSIRGRDVAARGRAAATASFTGPRLQSRLSSVSGCPPPAPRNPAPLGGSCIASGSTAVGACHSDSGGGSVAQRQARAAASHAASCRVVDALLNGGSKEMDRESGRCRAAGGMQVGGSGRKGLPMAEPPLLVQRTPLLLKSRAGDRSGVSGVQRYGPAPNTAVVACVRDSGVASNGAPLANVVVVQREGEPGSRIPHVASLPLLHLAEEHGIASAGKLAGRGPGSRIGWLLQQRPSHGSAEAGITQQESAPLPVVCVGVGGMGQALLVGCSTSWYGPPSQAILDRTGTQGTFVSAASSAVWAAASDLGGPYLGCHSDSPGGSECGATAPVAWPATPPCLLGQVTSAPGRAGASDGGGALMAIDPGGQPGVCDGVGMEKGGSISGDRDEEYDRPSFFRRIMDRAACALRKMVGGGKGRVAAANTG